jgi:hypothetical protein
MKKLGYLVGFCSLFILFTILSCNLFSPPPPVTITLSGGATCIAEDLNVTVDAWIVTEQASASPKLTVKICVSCKETPLSGVGGITGKLSKDAEEVNKHPQLNKTITFDSTNTKGCTIKSFRNVDSRLADKKFKVSVVDAKGNVVDEKEVVIKDKL